MEEKAKKLKLLEQKIAKCSACNLCQERTNTVPGTGNAMADIIFIGEGPGKKEDEQGQPFIGAAGRILNEMLEHINLNREDIFITNIVKCRPPKNRDPKIEEKNTCYPFLQKQIEIINPALIITLGRHAMEYFLPEAQISDVHGKTQILNQPNGKKQIIYPLYHPAAALYNPKTKIIIKTDFEKIPQLIKKIRMKENNQPSNV